MTMSVRVAVMLDGELIQVAPPQAIYSDPSDRRVAESLVVAAPLVIAFPAA